MDKNFKKIARPPHIIDEQNQYLLFFYDEIFHILRF